MFYCVGRFSGRTGLREMIVIRVSESKSSGVPCCITSVDVDKIYTDSLVSNYVKVVSVGISKTYWEILSVCLCAPFHRNISFLRLFNDVISI
jgi:hypothetical protein